MAKAKKCDRCGNLYENYNGIQMGKGGYHYNTIYVANDFITRGFDMCPECMTKLKKFLTEMKGEENDL